MGTPYLTAVGAPPVCTSKAFQPWYTSLINFRLAEIPIARTNRRYVSTAGSDANDGLTTASPWATLAKANSYLATAPTDTRVSFRRGDTWHEWVSTPYTGLTQSTAVTTKVTLTNPPMQQFWAGQPVTLSGGTSGSQNATVMAYTPSTGIVHLKESVALDHTGLSGYAVSTSASATVSTLTFAAPPAAVFNAAIPGLHAGSEIRLGQYNYYFVGDYNNATGVVTMQTLLPSTYTSFNTYVPSFLHVISGAVTLDDYSDGATGHRLSNAKPIFSAFGWIIPANFFYVQPPNGWTLTTSPAQTSGAVYESTINSSGQINGMPAALRVVGDNANYLTLTASLTDCDALSGSWWFDAAALKLYLHAPTGALPPTTGPAGRSPDSYEVAYRTGVTAVAVDDVDGVRLRNLRIEGYGAGDPGNQVFTGYAVHSFCSGSHAILYDGIEAFYAGRHALGNVQGAAGGIATYSGCVTGALTGDGGNIVTYSQTGGQEHLSVGCSAASGRLLYGRFSPYGNNALGGAGVGAFAHCGTGTLGLFLDVNATNVPGQAQVGTLNGTAGNSYPYTDLKDCNSFVIGQVFSAREPTALDSTVPNHFADGGAANGTNPDVATLGDVQGSQYNVYIGCKASSRLVWDALGGSDVAMLTTDSGGLHLNGDYKFDFRAAGLTLGQRSVWQTAGTVAPYFQASHCRFTLGGAVNAYYNLYRNAGTPGTVFKNCFFGVEGGVNISSSFSLNTGNNAANLANNAYSDVTSYLGTSGYSNDPFAVELSGLPGGPPLPGSPLLSANEQPLLSYRLGYDALGIPRSSTLPAIGPYEPLYVPIVTASVGPPLTLTVTPGVGVNNLAWLSDSLAVNGYAVLWMPGSALPGVGATGEVVGKVAQGTLTWADTSAYRVGLSAGSRYEVIALH